MRELVASRALIARHRISEPPGFRSADCSLASTCVGVGEEFVTSATDVARNRDFFKQLDQSGEHGLGFEAGAEDRLGVDAEPAFQRGRVDLAEVDGHREVSSRVEGAECRGLAVATALHL